MSKAADSFYHLPNGLPPHARCSGMACYVARKRNGVLWQEAVAQDPPVVCLGRCYQGPVCLDDPDERPHVGVHAPRAIVLERIVSGPMRTVRGFDALERARATTPEAVIEQIEMSGLRGRGGAGFSTGKKWRAVRNAAASEKFVVVNADEGDPGAYIDRFIMEDDPYTLLEGAMIAAYAVGARTIYIYVRAEYPRAYEILSQAVAAISESFEIKLVRGRGSYLCGEESSLLNSIEGRRPEVRLRPPYPSDHGLFGKPTAVNNVETLTSIPWIIRNGGAAYAELGSGASRGTKVVSLNSLFSRPGLYEVEFGIPLRSIVESLGGGLRDGKLAGVIVGGPLAGMLGPEQLDVAFTFEDLRAVGAEIGHGGIIAFDEGTTLDQLMEHVFTFGANESCGKCTPCRLGTRRVAALFADGEPGDFAEADAIMDALARTSLCAHGSGLAEFAMSVLPRMRARA